MSDQAITNRTDRPTGWAGLSSGFLKRWILYGFIAMAGGELGFALISGLLDNRGPVADFAGHLPTLVALGMVVAVAHRRALDLPLSWPAVMLCGVCAFLAYVGGFAVFGPPLDFLLSIVVIGLASGAGLWLTLRGSVRRAALCVAAVGLGYAVGAAVGVAAAIVLGDTVDHAFGGGVTGFMGVVGMIGIVAGAVGSVLSGLGLTWVLATAAVTEVRTAPSAS